MDVGRNECWQPFIFCRTMSLAVLSTSFSSDQLQKRVSFHLKADCSQTSPHFPASYFLFSSCFHWIQNHAAATCRNLNCCKHIWKAEQAELSNDSQPHPCLGSAADIAFPNTILTFYWWENIPPTPASQARGTTPPGYPALWEWCFWGCSAKKAENPPK